MTDNQRELFKKYAFTGHLDDNTIDNIVCYNNKKEIPPHNFIDKIILWRISIPQNIYNFFNKKIEEHKKKHKKENQSYNFIGFFGRKKDAKDLEIQRDLYVQLLEKKKNTNNTEIPSSCKDLIELTQFEIESQQERKSQFEQRSGFILATWGIIFSLSDSSLYIKNKWTLLFAICSLFFSIASLWPMKFGHYLIESKRNNYLSTVCCEELFYIRILTGLTNVWLYNEKRLSRKSALFKGSLLSIMAYAIAVIYYMKK